MNKFWKGVLINIAIIYAITFFIAILNGFYVFFIAPLVIALLELFFAAFFLISEKTREAAQIMFAACGLVLLIGLAVCSASALANP